MQLSVANKTKLYATRSIGLITLLCWVGLFANGQSTDVAAPTPVRANEVTGSITARDIGDPRLTDHYYAFTGTPGDVLITIDSRNLNGDIDVFTATGLRPLLKLTVYSSNTSPITKSIYLRKREDLILRVEARTPNDDEGTYRLSFSGSFEPIAGGPLLAEGGVTPVEDAATPNRGKKTRRVSSVGARIDEPQPAEVAVAPTPEPSPSEATATPAPVETKPAESTESTSAAVSKPLPRTPRGRRNPPPPRRTRQPARPRVEEPAEKTDVAVNPPAEEVKPVTTPPRRSTKKAATPRKTEETAVTATQEESGPRLMIETNDGTLINRYMSSVRRVTVENGQVVVVGKDGKIERIPLANLLRMSIAP